MYEPLRRLPEPTPTVPVPRWKHLRHDNRPWQKRVASGFLHAARLLAGFCVAGMAMIGLSWWSSAPINPNAPLAFLYGWWLLPIAATIMVLTAHRRLLPPREIAKLFKEKRMVGRGGEDRIVNLIH
jgi:hypothetical protein